MIKNLIIIVLVILIIIISVPSVYILTNYLFRRRYKTIYFSHGYNDDLKLNRTDNTMKYIEDSIEKGFQGIEIDIHYIEKLNDFILEHDYDEDENKDEDEEKLLLSEVFNKYRNSKKNIIFWLDHKNLNEDNWEISKSILESYQKKYNVNFLLESPSYKNLLLLSKSSNIKTCNWIDNKWHIFWPQDFDFISIPYEIYFKDKLFYDLFSPLPINIFTVNSPKILNKLSNQSNISYIITDINIHNVISK